MNVDFPVSLVFSRNFFSVTQSWYSSFPCIDMTSRSFVSLAVKDGDPISILTGKCPITFCTFSTFYLPFAVVHLLLLYICIVAPPLF
ncbi:hypothetical protein BDV28DRAFT_143929 [Aspergillus coremiiformis]|uniref:Uncharacterized protein n=1 Tax=Aspergillus coremiiformis TaxID=138285 RepID=A0A5N6YRX8_9EURO|nr:hypothetical protein BDV28DRAFT_143929 [Aspergillus coremiiformis]